MRKCIAWLLVLLLAFNAGGYYIAYFALSHQAHQNAHQLYENAVIAAEDIIELTIPLNLPYPVYSHGYEVARGSFEYQGQFYRLLRQKLDGHVLQVVCYKDAAGQAAEELLAGFIAQGADAPVPIKSSVNLVGGILKDYAGAGSFHLLCAAPGWFQELNKGFSTSPYRVPSLAIPVPPPKAA